MRILGRIAEAVVAGLGVASMYSYSVDMVPEPYNSLMLGGGAGLVAATVVTAQVRQGKKDNETSSEGSQSAKERKTPAKQKSKAPQQSAMKSFDVAFHKLVSRQPDSSRVELLDSFTSIINRLSLEIAAWTGDMRIRVYLLLQEIAKDVDDPTRAKASLGLIDLILSKGGPSALEMARPMFAETILRMYTDPRFDEDKFVPRLHLMMEGYEAKSVEKVTREAIHTWSAKRFSAAGAYLGLEGLAERGIRQRVKNVLRTEITNAGLAHDGPAAHRAIELYHAAN